MDEMETDEVGTEPLPNLEPEPISPISLTDETRRLIEQEDKRAGWRRAQARKRERQKQGAVAPDNSADPEDIPDESLPPEPRSTAKPPSRPRGPAPKRNRSRIPLTSLLETTLGGVSTGLIMTNRDAPVGMAIGFEAPVAAEKLDAIIAGTMLDRLLQPIARAGASAKDFGAVLALPILVGLIERRPYLYDPLRPLIIPIVTSVALDLAEMQERNKERLADAQARAGSHQVDVDQLMAMFFGQAMQQQPQPDPAQPAEPVGEPIQL